MFQRQKTGSVICPSCGKLVGVNDEKCYSCGRSRPGMWGFSKSFQGFGGDFGFVSLLLWSLGLVYLASVLVDTSAMFQGGLFGILSPTAQSLGLFGASGAAPVFGQGRWWTLLSAGWLHGGLLHIGFNVYALRFLGPLTAKLYGSGRFMIIFTVASVCGFTLSTLVGFVAPLLASGPAGGLFALFFNLVSPGGVSLTLGASAGLCGLVGALLYYGRRGGSSQLRTQAKGWVVSIVIFGILLPGIDNWAHLGGFIGGYLVSRQLDPLKPERTDHLIAAVVCLVLAALSIVVSVLHGLPR